MFTIHHSRIIIRDIRSHAYRLLAAASRRRGLAAIGVELSAANSEIQLTPIEDGPVVVRCTEEADGKLIGELDVELFRAALVIDRDGILEAKAESAASLAGRAGGPVAITLPGASGFRSEVVRKGALPYVRVFAIAGDDLSADGGVLVTMRSAKPDWPAADEVLATLRVLGRLAR